MKTLNALISFGFMWLITLYCNAQQEVFYTQYMFNQLAINPAYAGNSNALSLTMLSRKQWAGLSGSPTIFSFFAHSPMMKEKVGLGVMVFNENLGVTNTFQTNFSYAYKVKLNENRLSFGLQAMLINHNQNYRELDDVIADPSFGNNINMFLLNMGFGLYFEADQYYIGLSVPHVLENYYDPSGGEAARESRQYFANGGYVFYLNRALKLKPNCLIRYIQGLPPQFDLSANLLYREKIWFGLSIHQNSSLNAMIETMVYEGLRFGVAYDFVTGELNRITYGSLEFMINYNFKKTKNRIVNPRHF